MGGIPAAFSIHFSMNKGAKVISEAILGRDFRTVVIAGKAYTVHPPTIKRMAGAISHLSGVKEAQTIREVLLSLGDMDRLAKALSWFIAGDESLAAELGKGTLEEVVEALEAVADMIEIKVFLKAASLAKSVSLLAAKPR